jgi:hypothetical protein
MSSGAAVASSRGAETINKKERRAVQHPSPFPCSRRPGDSAQYSSAQARSLACTTCAEPRIACSTEHCE